MTRLEQALGRLRQQRPDVVRHVLVELGELAVHAIQLVCLAASPLGLFRQPHQPIALGHHPVPRRQRVSQRVARLGGLVARGPCRTPRGRLLLLRQTQACLVEAEAPRSASGWVRRSAREASSRTAASRCAS